MQLTTFPFKWAWVIFALKFLAVLALACWPYVMIAAIMTMDSEKAAQHLPLRYTVATYVEMLYPLTLGTAFWLDRKRYRHRHGSGYRVMLWSSCIANALLALLCLLS